MTAATPVWRQRPTVAAVGDADRTVLLDLDDPAHPPRILRGPAAAVWRAVDGRRTTAAICAHVAEGFGLPAAEVTPDVEAFLHQLAEGGLVEEQP